MNLDPLPLAPGRLSSTGGRDGKTSRYAELRIMRGAPTIAGDAADLAPDAAPHDRDASAPVQSRITVIALWLGHEDTVTTRQYVEADLAMKEAALRRVDDPAPQPFRFTAVDRLLDFLEGL